MRVLIPILLTAASIIAILAPCRADQLADAILRQAKAAAQAARTIDGAMVYTESEPGRFTCDIISVRFELPNKFHIEHWDNLNHVPDARENLAKEPHSITVGNGNWLWTIGTNGHVTRERQTPKLIAGTNIPIELDLFRLKYQPGPAPFNGGIRSYGGKRQWRGVLCDVVHVSNSNFLGAQADDDLYFDSNHFFRGETGTEFGGKRIQYTYTRFNLNTALPHGSFRFHGPSHRYVHLAKPRSNHQGIHP